MATLLLAEFGPSGIADTTARTLTAALQFGGEVHLLVAGHDAAGAAAAGAKLGGVAKVLHAEDRELEHQGIETLTATVVSLAPAYRALVAAATTTGKTVMPRVAAFLDVMQVSEAVRIIDPVTFERPIYAGNAIETVRSTDAQVVVTVRPAAFDATVIVQAAAPIEVVQVPTAQARSQFVSATLGARDRPELTSARVVVAGGRGLQSADDFRRYIEPLADKLKAAVGASRAAVDAGYAPNELQVGQTGKVVAPDLYIAIGISGAIQHLAGMKGAKTVVAINNDPEAPIFASADYWLVGDLREIVPDLTKEL